MLPSPVRFCVFGVVVAVASGVPAAWAAPLPEALDRNADGEIVVACLGDSNTASAWQHTKPGGFPESRGWCEQLGARVGDPRVRVVNVGLGGATASPNAYGELINRMHFTGSSQLDAVLAYQPVDVVMMAFGTNDVMPEHGLTATDIADSYNRLWRRARAHDLLGFVAITPPVYRNRRTGKYRRSPEAIAATNRALGEIFAPRHLLDFHSGSSPGEYLDDIHLNAAGQARRADEALRKLRALAEVTPPPAGVRALGWSAGHWSTKKPGDLSALVGSAD